MVESERMSIPSKRSLWRSVFDFWLPDAMQAVAVASASIAVGAMTVALITSVAIGRPVSGEIVCPRVFPPSFLKLR